MKPITTRGPAQAATRNGNSGDRRQGAEITGALLAAATRPDPEVAEKPQRRRFTAEYKVRILRDADVCAVPGEIGALLRREGLYSSHLTEWRRQREQGALAGLAPNKRGRRGAPPVLRQKRVRVVWSIRALGLVQQARSRVGGWSAAGQSAVGAATARWILPGAGGAAGMDE